MSIRQNFPTVSPTLTLDFINSSQLDPRITFIRTGSATRMNENGLVESVGADIPRFEHRYENGVVKPQGLLLEEAKQNFIQVSAPSPSDISQSSTAEGWRDRSNLNLEYSSVTSPDGTNNAVGVAYTSAYTTYQIPFIYNDSGTLNNNNFYTLSYWVDDSELVESNNFHLSTIIGTNGWSGISGRYFIVHYNKTSDTFGSPNYYNGSSVTAENANTIFTDISGTVSHYPNNWKRISISFKLDSSYDGYYDSGDTNADFIFNYGIYMGVAGYTNDNVGNNMKTWGWQLEARHMTSYIPTSGSTVVSSSDICYIDNLDTQGLINQSEFTIHIEGKYNPTVKQVSTAYLRMMETRTGLGTQRTSGLWLDPTTQTEWIRYRADDDNENSIFLKSYKTTNINDAVDTGKDGLLRIAFGLKSGDFDISVNGGSLQSSSNTGFAQDTGQLIIGGESDSGNDIMNGTLRKLSIYPNKLTDTQLINLSKVSI